MAKYDLPFPVLVRLPCDLYEEEYKACKGWRGRFNQYFVYGKLTDCTKWHDDFVACSAYLESGNKNDLVTVIQHEEERLAKRRSATMSNDVWEYRKEPPKEWSQELPGIFTSPLLKSAEKELETGNNEKATTRSFFESLYSWLID